MTDLRQLIIDDMKPALGVTEPAAIALACAQARALSDEPVEKVVVRVNSGIYKNAFTCGIPGTAEVGNEYSAALGIVCGDAEKGLCVLEDVNDAAVAEAKKMIGDGRVKVELDSISSVLFIGATVYTAHDVCRGGLRASHTNFCLIEKNGRKLLEKPYVHSDADRSPIVECSIADIYDFALNTPIEQLKFMLEAYRVNEDLAEAGAAWERCTITRSMIAQNGGRLISDDPRQSAKTYACAAAEALPALAGKKIRVLRRDIEIGADYTSEEPIIAVRIVLSLQLFRLVHLAVALGAEFLKWKINSRREQPAAAMNERKDDNGRE